MIKCGNCGCSLAYKKASSLKCAAKYECSGYMRHGKTLCTSHRICFNDLYNIVLDNISKNIELVTADKNEYICCLVGISAE